MSKARPEVGPRFLYWLGGAGILLLVLVVAVSVRARYAVGPSAVTKVGAGSVLLASVVHVLLLVFVATFELLLVLAVIYAPWRRLAQAGKGVPVSALPRGLALRMVMVPAFLITVDVVVFLLVAHRRTGSPSGPLRIGAASAPTHHQGVVPLVSPASVAITSAVAGVLALLLVAAVLTVRLRRRRSWARFEDPSLPLPDLTSALDTSLAELAAGGDPRQGVIRAYERMVRILSGAGISDLAFETPSEYLERVLGRLDASRRAVMRLTDLFELARFSSHPVGPAMRAEAEDALLSLRSELSGGGT